ncbi:hypothetical protein MFIFM68171_04485 [Madurella fahalii]|uniref:DUF6594 domain-containing protein n=1 Tax=Madurella fahalii TaxID=1157608 RepID=A0ABQ0G991_9PEZI
MEESTTRSRIAFAQRLLTRLFDVAGNADPESQVPREGTVHEERPDPSPSSKDPDFIYREDFEKFPFGWPRFARTQNCYHNGSIHRRFGGLTQRILHHLEVAIAKRETRLLQLDKEDEANNSPRLFSLTPAQACGEADGAQAEACEQDRIIAESISLLAQYNRALLHDVETRKLHDIGDHEFLNLLDTAKEFGILGGAAMDYLIEPHDFITTRTKRLHQSFEALIFGGKSPLLTKLLSKKDAPNCSPYRVHFDTRWFTALFAAGIALLGLFLYFFPVAILYFLEPSKGWSAGVVVIFGVFFTVILSQLPHIKLDTICVGLAAYVAVMVAFLANYEASQCRCPVSAGLA